MRAHLLIYHNQRQPRWAIPETLHPSERAYWETLVGVRRDEYLCGHALLHLAVSHFADNRAVVIPAQGAPSASGIPLSLSHSGGFFVVGICQRAPVGVDVESVGRVRSPLDLAKRFFHRAEHRSMASLPSREHAKRFTHLWTLKESWAKARGLSALVPSLSREEVKVEPSGAPFQIGGEWWAQSWTFGETILSLVTLGASEVSTWCIDDAGEIRAERLRRLIGLERGEERE